MDNLKLALKLEALNLKNEYDLYFLIFGYKPKRSRYLTIDCHISYVENLWDKRSKILRQLFNIRLEELKKQQQ